MIERGALPFYRMLRELYSAQEGKECPSVRESILHALRHPAGMQFAPSRALRSLLYAKLEGKPVPPIDYDFHGSVPKYGESCELALLGLSLGDSAALPFAKKLLSWGSPPFSVGYLEGEFNEAEQKKQYALLKEKVQGALSYFVDPAVRMVGCKSRLFTLSGHKTPMGSFGAICAMGPELWPISGTRGFGVHWTYGAVKSDLLFADEKSCRLEGWTRSGSTWVEAKIDSKEGLTEIKFRPSGGSIAISFYLSGSGCRVGGQMIAKRSLQRFKGMAAEIVSDKLTIQTTAPIHIDVVPLAGEGVFWNADFLVSFEIGAQFGWTEFKVIG